MTVTPVYTENLTLPSADRVNCFDLTGLSGRTKRADYLKRKASLQKRLNEHLEKIRENPTSRDVPGWQKEIRGWEKQIADIDRRLNRMDDGGGGGGLFGFHFPHLPSPPSWFPWIAAGGGAVGGVIYYAPILLL